MSHLFKDTLQITLHADKVELCRRSGRVKPRPPVHAVQTLATQASATATTELLDTLEQMLQEPQWRGLDVEVVLSNALVCYAIVPASAEVLAANDELALAQLKFRQIHGPSDVLWDIRLGNLLAGGDQVAAALEQGFLARLRDVLLSAQLRIRSVEPALMRGFKRMRGKLAGSDVWFVQAEPGLVVLAHVRAGAWTSLAALHSDGSLAQCLPGLLREASLLAGQDVQQQRIYLDAVGVDTQGLDTLTGLNLSVLARQTGMARPRPLMLDFAHPQRQSRAQALVVVAGAALLLSLALWHSDQSELAVAELETELSQLGGQPSEPRQRADAPPLSSAELEDKVRKANRIIRQLNTPWEDVFGALERSNGDHVALLSLESDPASAQVRVSAEARNARRMLDYMERLHKDGRLWPAVLQTHQIMIEDPLRPIRFTYTASWTSAKQAQK